jgi:hypothetical protein
MSTITEAAEAAHKVASIATYGGSGAAIYFGFSPGEWQAIGIIGGLVFAAAGYLTNFYFKRQHLLLARAKAQADPEE